MMKNRTFMKTAAIFAGLVVIAASLVLLFRFAETLIDRTENDGIGETSGEVYGRIAYNGAYYVPRDTLETLLVLGIDSLASESAARAESRQVDFLALVIFDRETDHFQILHLNRDTMTDITRINDFGETYGTYEAQLAMAHTYGADDRAQCRNTLNAVENLLYGIDIDHYLSITMDAVSILNDSVGGVTLSLLDDFTYLDPAYTAGTTVTLTGDEALAYVRSRTNMEDSTNLRRMERQQHYIGALFEKYNTIDDIDLLENMWKINEYMISDCTIDQLTTMFERVGEYAYDGILSLQGEEVLGEEFMEYYIDESAAQELVISLFYELEE